MTTPRAILDLCRECATTIGVGDVEEVSRLLFGTAAQESDGFAWRRQLTPAWGGGVGGFSLWQLERAAVRDGLRQMRDGVLRDKCARFLFGREWEKAIAAGWPGRWTEEFAVEMLRSTCGDRLGVLLARLYYLRCPGAVPAGPEAQALYWKRFYNTSAGKGTPEQYLSNWARFCAPTVGD
jgi:hypothetical protein